LSLETCYNTTNISIQVAAFFNYSNRVASALALRPNHEYHSMARKGAPR
jgi:hypothetical protein